MLIQVYVHSSEGKRLLRKLDRLLVKIPCLSRGAVVMTCLAACIDTLEKELPTGKPFKLNGKDVIL